MYLVLLHVNIYALPSSHTTHVLPCFFAFSSASELWRAASAASAPAVAEVVEGVAVLALAEFFEAFGANFVGSNLTPKLPNHLVLTLGSAFVVLFEVDLDDDISMELADGEVEKFEVLKRSKGNGSEDVDKCWVFAP